VKWRNGGSVAGEWSVVSCSGEICNPQSVFYYLLFTICSLLFIKLELPDRAGVWSFVSDGRHFSDIYHGAKTAEFMISYDDCIPPAPKSTVNVEVDGKNFTLKFGDNIEVRGRNIIINSADTQGVLRKGHYWKV